MAMMCPTSEENTKINGQAMESLLLELRDKDGHHYKRLSELLEG
jgi:hypothetical protein